MKQDLSGLKIDKNKRSTNSATRSWWGWVLFLLVLCGLVFVWFQFVRVTGPDGADVAAADAPEPDVPAVVDSEREREVLVASGYVVAHHKHELGSKVMGKVEWIGVEKGDRVRKGQLLVKLEDREYRAQLDQAEAAVRTAEARLAELEAGSRPEEIERAEAELKRREKDRDNARLELERTKTLLDSGVLSQQQFDSAKLRHEMANAAADAARKDLELLRIGPRTEQIDQARAEVERLRASVRYFQTLTEATEIRAPIDGTVIRRIAEVGEMVTTSFAGESGAKSAVVVLADLTDLQVELDISETDFRRISSSNECRMNPEAFPDRTYACVIDEISPEANRQKASIQVKVKVLDPDDFLRPEMSARVTFLKKEDENGRAAN